MKLDEYLTRYRMIQHAVEKEERLLEWMESAPYRAFLHRFSEARDETLSSLVLTREAMERRLAHHRRLQEKYAARLARACLAIPQIELREYAICHYLYGMTHEDLAERSQFCVRTVYRHGKQAKKALTAALLALMPRPVRTEPRRYVPKSPVHFHGVVIHQVSRRAAEERSRRRRTAPITAGYFTCPLPT